MGKIKNVKDQHPLKQGLKLNFASTKEPVNCVKDQHPLKQGLKQYSPPYIIYYHVKDQHPLKQGLKLPN